MPFDFNTKAVQLLRTVARHMREASPEHEIVTAIHEALNEANKAGFDEARRPAPLDADF